MNSNLNFIFQFLLVLLLVQVSVDSLSWEFIVSMVDDNHITSPPKDGVWVKGLFLEGAGWDKKNACLVEAAPMQLTCPVPTIHFKPSEAKKKSGKGKLILGLFYSVSSSYRFIALDRIVLALNAIF